VGGGAEEALAEAALAEAARLGVPSGQCRAPLPLMRSTGERCWRACAGELEVQGEEAGDVCRQACGRMAGMVNEDMALVALGEAAEVVDFYRDVNISDAGKVGALDAAPAEGELRVASLVVNVWAAAVLAGRLDEAEAAVARLLPRHPRLAAPLHYTRGAALAAQGRLQEARRSFRRCAGRSSRVAAQCRQAHAWVLLEQGHTDRAIQQLAQAAAQLGGPGAGAGAGGAAHVRVLSTLVAARLRQGDAPGAWREAQAALTLAPRNVLLRLQAALAARRAGRPRAARAVLEAGLAAAGGGGAELPLLQALAGLMVDALAPPAGGGAAPLEAPSDPEVRPHTPAARGFARADGPRGARGGAGGDARRRGVSARAAVHRPLRVAVG